MRGTDNLKNISNSKSRRLPSIHGGTEIPVYPKTNDQNHLNDFPLFIVRIQEQPHSVFQRNRLNLIYTATIDLLFAYKRQRRTLRVPSIGPKSFHEIEFDENEIIQTDSQCTILSAGLPNETSPEIRGDLIIKFKFQIPTTSDEFHTLIQQFQV